MSSSKQPTHRVPDHVPGSLVMSYPFSFGARTTQDPFSTFVSEMHTRPEIFYTMTAYPSGEGSWVLRRTEDLRTVYMDTDHFSNEDFAPFAKLLGESWGLVPAETDPPMHQLYRSFVNPLFTPKAINALDAKIRAYAQQYVSDIKAKGHCEFMSEFAFEFPIKVFLELIDLPQHDAGMFLIWVGDLLHATDLGVLVARTREVVAYLRDVIASRKRAPGDDMVSYGVKAEIDGRKLTDDELLGFFFNLFVGGLDTVSSNMGLQFWHLARHADDQQRLRENRGLIPDAISELMRAYANVTTFRTCKKQTQIKGVTFMPGDKVAMPTTLAGRDPQEYERPDEVVLDRRPRHLSFAYGPHLCVGMHLATREMRMAMEEFLGSIPPFTLASDATVEFLLSGVIQPVSVPLVWS